MQHCHPDVKYVTVQATDVTSDTASVASLGDQALLTEFCETGSETAFRTLVERHAPMVSSVCMAVLGNRCDAEDAFQAAFFVLARNAKKIVKRHNMVAWLHRVALRCALGARRRRKIRKTAQLPSEDILAQGDLDKVSSRAMIQSLHEQLNQLPEEYRVPLIIRYLHGEDCATVARRLQISEVALRKRLQRGRVMLRRRLAACGLAGFAIANLCNIATAEGLQAASPTLLDSTITIATQVKCAWAKGLMASTGQQSSLALAEGVMKTMLFTSITKATLAICLSGVIGFVAIVTHSAAQEERPVVAIHSSSVDLQDGPPQPEDAQAKIASSAQAPAAARDTRIQDPRLASGQDQPAQNKLTPWFQSTQLGHPAWNSTQLELAWDEQVQTPQNALGFWMRDALADSVEESLFRWDEGSQDATGLVERRIDELQQQIQKQQRELKEQQEQLMMYRAIERLREELQRLAIKNRQLSADLEVLKAENEQLRQRRGRN